MIAPTGRAIAIAAAGAPLALLVALARPEWWVIAALWLAVAIGAVAFDAMLAVSPRGLTLSHRLPSAVGVGEPFTADFAVESGGGRGTARDLNLALEADSRLAPTGRIDAPLRPDERGQPAASLTLSALRRGTAAITRGWVGWTGPLGLARLQKRVELNAPIAVAPSIRPVRDDVGPLFTRDAQVGQRLNARLGEGSEFESLVRFMPGLDRRAIDWKQSARHADLLAKQFEVERDNRIMLVVDAGRMMCEPVIGADGAAEPRLDRAVSAALALGYAALRLEDRVSLSSIGARPMVSQREYVRVSDFAALRRAAASIDYTLEETNFTLGLAQVGAALKRRSMIVIFTEFADASSAELMIRAAERLVTKHLLLFVVMADSELEAITGRVPADAQDVAAATIAADLLRDRRVVLTRLRRMGAIVVEAPADGMAASLLAAYVRIKRQGKI